MKQSLTEKPRGRGIELQDYFVRTVGGKCLVECAKLAIQPGRIHAVIGPNGSGKTSLFRGMTGILRSSGVIRVDGEDVSKGKLEVRTRMLAYQPQGKVNGDGITAREFVIAGCSASAGWLGGATKQQLERCERAMELSGSLGMADRLLDSLSGGESARVALSATLSSGASWLLLDEPVAAADIGAARKIYALLRDLVDEDHASVVVIEHDLGLARSFADDVTLIDSGKVVLTGAVEDVFASPLLEKAYHTTLSVVEAGENAWAVVALDEQVGAAIGARGVSAIGDVRGVPASTRNDA